MATLQIAKIEELFVALNENLPITKDLITQSHNEFTAIKTHLSKNDFIAKPKSGKKELGTETCPHCKKQLPKDERKDELSREVERLEQEVAAYSKRCQQLETELDKNTSKDIRNDNNVANTIIQLNDPNRVHIIGQKFEDLYNQEWRQVFGFLDNVMNLREDKVLDVLLRILRAAYSFCGDIARAQLINIEGEIYCPLSTWTEDTRFEMIGRNVVVPPSIEHMAKRHRTSSAMECIPALQNVFIAQILPEFMDPTIYNHSKILDYVKKCVAVTWYMWIQETPMVLVSKVNRKDPFDTDLFQFYTKSGDRYDFVVWPALLVQEQGSLVARGVAQALDPNRNIPNLRESMESRWNGEKIDEINRPRKPSMPGRGKRGDTPNPALGGSPWGSNFYSDPAANTPSMDLPPLPAQNVSPTRVSLPKDPDEDKKVLTVLWQPTKPKANK